MNTFIIYTPMLALANLPVNSNHGRVSKPVYVVGPEYPTNSNYWVSAREKPLKAMTMSTIVDIPNIANYLLGCYRHDNLTGLIVTNLITRSYGNQANNSLLMRQIADPFQWPIRRAVLNGPQ